MLNKEQWDNSRELRHSVEQRLRDWGWHQFGGEPDLGYPNHSPFTDPPRPDYQHYHPEHGPDDADVVARVITSCAQASLEGLRNSEVLRMQFIRRDLTQKQRAARLGYSRRTYQRRLDAAMFWFYRISDQFDQPAADWVRHG
jgi:predicted DNA-binding protein (UPF0251 family)